MEFPDRKKCFCTECCGQLVARRTFYEHQKRNALRRESRRDFESIPDPFDADISSDEDDMFPESSSTVHSVSEDGMPSSKHARLLEDEVDKVVLLLEQFSIFL